MPIYSGTTPKQFKRCLDSILVEKNVIDKLIIAQDGKISSTLMNIIDGLVSSRVHCDVVKSDKNIGLGQILNLVAASHPDINFWFRIDSDDWNICKRLATQKEFLCKNPQIDVLHGGIVEISDNNASNERKYIAGDLSKYEGSWIRNPVNHVSCVLSRRIFFSHGGYSLTLRYSQDYELWARVLSNGGVIYGLAGGPIVSVDVGANIQQKRPLIYMIDEFIALLACYKYGKLNLWALMYAIFLRLLLRSLLPRKVSQFLSTKFR